MMGMGEVVCRLPSTVQLGLPHPHALAFVFRYFRVEFDCVPEVCTPPASVRDEFNKFCIVPSDPGSYWTVDGAVECPRGTYQVRDGLALLAGSTDRIRMQGLSQCPWCSAHAHASPPRGPPFDDG